MLPLSAVGIPRLQAWEDVNGSRISGAGIYEGRDGPGCVTFVPSGPIAAVGTEMST